MSLEKELEFAKHRMEVLRMARQMLNEEYINRRAEDHNRWLAESDQAWKNKGIKLPYPPFAPYPTEAQILERAQELLKFVVREEDAEKVLPPAPAAAAEEPKSPPEMVTVPEPKAPEPEVPHAPVAETPSFEYGTLSSGETTKTETKKRSFWSRGE